MSQPFPAILQTVEVMEPQESQGLQVFGLRWNIDAGPDYVTLDEALAAQTLDITEISEGGSVPCLKLINKGDTMVFLMNGEQLIGAKQNRVLNSSILSPAHGEMNIPVSCVEAGRWRYRSAKFTGSDSSSHSTLRKLMTKQVHESYRSHGAPDSRQGEVWQEVDRKLTVMKSSSPTKELNQTYLDCQCALDDTLTRLPVPEGACGVVFAIAGKVAGVELFDKPSTLSKLWAKLVRSYAIDVLECRTDTDLQLTSTNVSAWLQSAAQMKSEPFRSPGMGEDVRLQGDKVFGASLVVEGHPVHVELFAEA